MNRYGPESNAQSTPVKSRIHQLRRVRRLVRLATGHCREAVDLGSCDTVQDTTSAHAGSQPLTGKGAVPYGSFCCPGPHIGPAPSPPVNVVLRRSRSD
jgi:hypothetical protein